MLVAIFAPISKLSKDKWMGLGEEHFAPPPRGSGLKVAFCVTSQGAHEIQCRIYILWCLSNSWHRPL